MSVTEMAAQGSRRCGDCQLCCKLLPVKSIGKLAGRRCQHQRHHKGCAVYAKLMRVSPECRLWNCRWLTGNDTADLSRPDRSHYVIDLMPDYVTLRPHDGSEPQHIQVVQVWIDPDYPDAHNDPALRAYLERRAATEGCAAIFRFDNERALVCFAPSISEDRQWNLVESNFRREPHSFADVVAKLGGQG